MHTMQLNRSAPRGGVGTVQLVPSPANTPTPPVSGLAAALGIRLMAYAMGEFHAVTTSPVVTYRTRRISSLSY